MYLTALPSLVSGMERLVGSLFVLLKFYSGAATSTGGEGVEICQLAFRVCFNVCALLILFK